MKEKINNLFQKQLDEIADPELKEKVVEIWVTAAEKGGWNPGDLDRIPFTLLIDAHGINLIEHTIAVTEGALSLGRIIKDRFSHLPVDIDFDWLVAGGLLHDVGKLLEIEKTPQGAYRKSHEGKCARHPISGAVLVAEAGLPHEIVNMVACHSKEGEGRPKRIETVLIHQADFAVFDPLVLLDKNLLIV